MKHHRLSKRSKDYLYGKRSLGKKKTWQTIQGTICGFGKRFVLLPGGIEVHKPTILLKNVHTLDGRFKADHLWIKYNNELGKLKVGQILQLTGQVAEYSKVDKYNGGYINNIELRNIRDLKIVEVQQGV